MTTVVGLIPAAGRARRISPLPGSKELFPIGFCHTTEGSPSKIRAKVVSEYLLESMVLAGAKRIFMILNKRKWDILCYFGDGNKFGTAISYLVVDHLRGMPFTLNQARPWLKDETILFGMPDTIFTPRDAFVQLLGQHRQNGNDLTLGLFRTNTPHRFGMVGLGQSDHVALVVDKPAQTDLTYMWGIACWSSCFTSFLDDQLQNAVFNGREVVMGDIFQSAIEERLKVRGVRFDSGEYVDVGTPEDLRHAVQHFS